MATVSLPRDPHMADKSEHSPVTSQASSIIGSPETQPTGQNGSATPSVENLHATNLASHPADAQHKPAAAEKPSMTKRLTRMFSTKEATRTSSEGPASSQSSVKSGVAASGVISPRPAPPSRSSSHTDKPAVARVDKKEKKEEKKEALKKGNGKDGANPASQRFIVNADQHGGHEHHLKSARRQEKLSDMLRDMLAGKKKHEQNAENDQQLSLMSSWVDQLKSEKESLASDKKGGPSATATLVEKYGKCHEIVGRGAFGIVRISHKRSEGMGEQLFAVKEFRRRPEENEKKYSKRLTAEFCISSSLRHPNVIHTLDLLKDSKGDYCEVMEFCAGGDLYTLVLAAGKLEVAEADCYFKQLMRGVEYMHEMGVAHRDLKPENLLLTTHGALKITDFGNGECFRMAWETEPHMVNGLCGSAPYISPEEYIDKEFDARAVDVWATGVIYMAMRTGRHLWRVAKKSEDEFYAKYLVGRRDEEGYAPIESLHRVCILSPIPVQNPQLTAHQARCRNVIYSILDPNPSRRITASQVLKSEWGREIKLCKAGEEGF
jgi:protein-serine/threonine kinase